MTRKYQWTDVWVLASIVLIRDMDVEKVSDLYYKNPLSPELSKYKNIYQVMSAGDYINHAVFTNDELTSGVGNLLEGDFVHVVGDCLRPTKSTIDYYEQEVGERKRISKKTLLTITRSLLEVEK